MGLQKLKLETISALVLLILLLGVAPFVLDPFRLNLMSKYLAFAFVAMQEVFSMWTKHWQLAMGLLIVAAVLFMPGGLSAVPGRIKRALQGGSAND